MGTRMAPNYAIIFMHKIETELLQKSPLQPTFFKRFIDDIFLIWPHGEEELQKFLEMINNHHKMIKFTEEHSTKEIAFLDTLVYKENGKLLTKVYHKKKRTKNNIYITNHHTPEIRRTWYHMDYSSELEEYVAKTWISKKRQLTLSHLY